MKYVVVSSLLGILTYVLLVSEAPNPFYSNTVVEMQEYLAARQHNTSLPAQNAEASRVDRAP